MVVYKIIYTKNALKYKENLKRSGLNLKVKMLIDILKNNPYQNPPPYEKLENNLKGLFSRRINLKHRLVYEIFEEQKIIKILSLWPRYEF